MIERVRAFLDRVNSLPERKVLWVNVGIACMIAIAHGSALSFSISGRTPDGEGIRTLAAFSLPIAAIVLFSAAAGLVRLEWTSRVLALHGFILAGAAVVLLAWATSLLVVGIPKVRFSWSVGLLSVSVGYAFLILHRFSLPGHLKTLPLVRDLPIFALLVAVPVDVGVFVRLLGDIHKALGT